MPLIASAAGAVPIHLVTEADVEEADMASSEEGDGDEEEEDSSGQTKSSSIFF